MTKKDRAYLAWKRFERTITDALKKHGATAARTTSGKQGQAPIPDIEAQYGPVELAIECKSSIRGQRQFAVKKEWFDRLDTVRGTRIGILVFNFYRDHQGPIYCLRSDQFWQLMSHVEEAV